MNTTRYIFGNILVKWKTYGTLKLLFYMKRLYFFLY